MKKVKKKILTFEDIDFDVSVRRRPPSKEDYRNKSDTAHKVKTKYNRRKEKSNWTKEIYTDE